MVVVVVVVVAGGGFPPVIEAPMILQLAPLQFPEVSILTFPDPELTL